MLSLDFLSGKTKPCILFLGAHCDDIEIGCGGTILRLMEDFPSSVIYWVVLSGDTVRSKEAKQSALAFSASWGNKQIVLKEFRDSFFPYIGGEIKEYFRSLQRECKPDLIFTHYQNDLHQDHRLISELTWNTFRNNLILEYEIPKWDGDIGQPNFFIRLEKRIADQKIETIMKHFASQSGRDWFEPSTFYGLMRIRGMESRAQSGYAEAFYCRKMII